MSQYDRVSVSQEELDKLDAEIKLKDAALAMYTKALDDHIVRIKELGGKLQVAESMYSTLLQNSFREVKNLESRLEKEHENFLAAHRDNMSLINRNADLKIRLESAKEALGTIVRDVNDSGFARNIAREALSKLDAKEKE